VLVRQVLLIVDAARRESGGSGVGERLVAALGEASDRRALPPSRGAA
jgi:hypothetical protein